MSHSTISPLTLPAPLYTGAAVCFPHTEAHCFKDLQALLRQYASPAVASTIVNSGLLGSLGNRSLFLPTARAFQAQLDRWGISVTQFLSDRSSLAKVVESWMMPGTVLIEDMPPGSPLAMMLAAPPATVTRNPG